MEDSGEKRRIEMKVSEKNARKQKDIFRKKIRKRKIVHYTKHPFQTLSLVYELS